MKLRNPDTYEAALNKAVTRSINEGSRMYVIYDDKGFYGVDELTESMKGLRYKVKCSVFDGAINGFE